MARKIQKLKPTKIYNLKTPDAIKEYLASIGAKGGSVKSEAKAKAARENAKKPRKKKRNSKDATRDD